MKLHPLAMALATVLAAAFPAAPASATNEHKPTHGSQCVANGTSTTTAELSFGSFGVSNPGTTDETAVCPVPIDSEQEWLQTGTDPIHMVVLWRPGSVAGRIVCTTFTGSIAAQDGPVTSTTWTSDVRPANSSVSMIAASPAAPEWGETAPPAPVVSLVCVLGPKTKIGGIFMVELHETHQP
jgi:hypothetical protein